MANPSTFIKIDRNILRWRWYGDKNTLAVFIHILLKANFADSFYFGNCVHRGQYAFSQRTLANDMGMTRSAVRTALDHLVDTGEITIQGFPRYTIVTVVNYDKYQTKPLPSPPPKPKPKQKTKANKSEQPNKVPEEYTEYFGDDYEAYERWVNQ